MFAPAGYRIDRGADTARNQQKLLLQPLSSRRARYKKGVGWAAKDD
jgi:hypothetical protein